MGEMISDFPCGLNVASLASGVIIESDVSRIAESGLSDVAEDNEEIEDADEVIGRIPAAAAAAVDGVVAGGLGCGSCGAFPSGVILPQSRAARLLGAPPPLLGVCGGCCGFTAAAAASVPESAEEAAASAVNGDCVVGTLNADAAAGVAAADGGNAFGRPVSAGRTAARLAGKLPTAELAVPGAPKRFGSFAADAGVVEAEYT